MFHQLSAVLGDRRGTDNGQQEDTKSGSLAEGVSPPGASRQLSPQEKSQEIGIWTMCCGRELPWSGEPQGGGWPGGLDDQTHDSRCNDAYWKSRLRLRT